MCVCDVWVYTRTQNITYVRSSQYTGGLKPQFPVRNPPFRGLQQFSSSIKQTFTHSVRFDWLHRSLFLFLLFIFFTFWCTRALGSMLFSCLFLLLVIVLERLMMAQRAKSTVHFQMIICIRPTTHLALSCYNWYVIFKKEGQYAAVLIYSV